MNGNLSLRSWARLLTAIAVATVWLVWPADVGAAAPPPSLPELVSQSEWSTVDQPFVVSFSMPGIATTDAIRATVYEPVGSGNGDRWADMFGRRLTGELGTRSGASVDVAPGTISTTGQVSVTLPPDQFANKPGVFPISLDIQRFGSSIGNLVTWAVRLPNTAARFPLRVMFLSVHRSTPLTQTDGKFAATPAQRSELQRILGLQKAAAPGSLVSTLYPETLVGLAQSEDRADQALEKQLSSALAKTDNLRTGYTNLHLGLWAANTDNPDLAISYATGYSEFERLVGITTEAAIAPPDPSMTPQSVAALAASGTELFLVDPEVAKVPYTSVRPTRRTVQINTGTGQSQPGLIVDSQLSKSLADVTTISDRVAFQAELAATALDGMDVGQAPGGASTPQLSAGEAAVVTVDARTSPTQLGALTTALSGSNGLVELAHPSDLREPIEPAAANNEQPTQPASLALDNTPANIMGTLPERTLRLRQRLNAERMTFQNQDPFGPAADARLLAAITLGTTTEYRDTALDSIDTSSSARLALVGLAKQSSITATSSTAALPIQIRNDSKYPATVRIRFRSDRIALDAGKWLEVSAAPGVTTVEAPATLRSSGVFPVHTQLLSADGAVVLDDQSIVVRSTAFSGVGLIVGGVSLGCLLLWWIRTVIRDRRSRHDGPKVDATGDVANSADDPDNLP